MRPSFQVSAQTQTLVGIFREMPVRKQMTFAQASKKAGFEVTSTLPAYISARKIAERDFGAFITSCRGTGFMRGNGSDMVASGQKVASTVRKASKRGMSRMALAMAQNLTQSEHGRASELFNRFSIIHSTAVPSRVPSNRAIVEDVPLI